MTWAVSVDLCSGEVMVQQAIARMCQCCRFYASSSVCLVRTSGSEEGMGLAVFVKRGSMSVQAATPQQTPCDWSVEPQTHMVSCLVWWVALVGGWLVVGWCHCACGEVWMHATSSE
jgi:hypothetical protein